MDRVFKSKVDWWYHLLLFILVFICIIVALNGSLLVVGIMLVITAFAIHVLLNTYYVITADGILLVRCSVFPKKDIAIKDIEAIEPSILPAFSYSLSLNRLILWKEGLMWMLVSPVNQKEFIQLLRKFNPDIKIINQVGTDHLLD